MVSLQKTFTLQVSPIETFLDILKYYWCLTSAQSSQYILSCVALNARQCTGVQGNRQEWDSLQQWLFLFLVVPSELWTLESGATYTWNGFHGSLLFIFTTKPPFYRKGTEDSDRWGGSVKVMCKQVASSAFPGVLLDRFLPHLRCKYNSWKLGNY